MFAFLSFSIYGLREFTASGFKRNSLRDDFVDKAIQYGHGLGFLNQNEATPKNFIITGINSGIGKQTVLSLISLEGIKLGKIYLGMNKGF
jgi:hypothetical protein